jgi:hypothetical protein
MQTTEVEVDDDEVIVELLCKLIQSFFSISIQSIEIVFFSACTKLQPSPPRTPNLRAMRKMLDRSQSPQAFYHTFQFFSILIVCSMLQNWVLQKLAPKLRLPLVSFVPPIQ